MNRNLSYFFIVLLFSLTIVLVAQSDEVLVPIDQSTMSKGLMVNINVGNIEIKGTDRNDILVKYNFIQEHRRNSSDIQSDGLKRISISKSSVDITTKNDRLIVSSLQHKKIELYIEVPQNINIETMKGGPGTLVVDNIIGNINLENNSGSIEVTNMDGIVNASTNEGSIKVEFSLIPEEYSMILANVIGDLEISIPKEHSTTFLMKTANGELLTNLDLKMESSVSKNTKISESSKGFSYTNNTWTNATLNSGGPEITLSTMSGNIIIRGR